MIEGVLDRLRENSNAKRSRSLDRARGSCESPSNRESFPVDRATQVVLLCDEPTGHGRSGVRGSHDRDQFQSAWPNQVGGSDRDAVANLFDKMHVGHNGSMLDIVGGNMRPPQ